MFWANSKIRKIVDIATFKPEGAPSTKKTNQNKTYIALPPNAPECPMVFWSDFP